MRKLFFGLWPPATLRDQLYALNALVTEPGGRPTTRDNLHLTLHFIGSTGHCDAIATAAAAIIGQPFELQLNQWGHFRKPRILWLGPSQSPQALLALASDCATVAEHCGAPGDQRAFRPHVSLQRKIGALPLLPEVAPLPWRVDEFYLFESVSLDDGVHYERLQRYPLMSE